MIYGGTIKSRIYITYSARNLGTKKLEKGSIGLTSGGGRTILRDSWMRRKVVLSMASDADFDGGRNGLDAGIESSR